MSNLYATITTLCASRGISGYRLCKDIGIQPSIITDLKSGRKKGLSAETADKVASYFDVSVSYLLNPGMAKEKPLPEQERSAALPSGLRVSATKKSWVSAKDDTLSMVIDSNLLRIIKLLAKQEGLTIADWIERELNAVVEIKIAEDD